MTNGQMRANNPSSWPSAASARTGPGWIPPRTQTDRFSIRLDPRLTRSTAYAPPLYAVSQNPRSFAAPRGPAYLSIAPNHPASSSWWQSKPCGFWRNATCAASIVVSPRMVWRRIGSSVSFLLLRQLVPFRLGRIVFAAQPGIDGGQRADRRVERRAFLRRRLADEGHPQPRRFEPVGVVPLDLQLDGVGQCGGADRQRSAGQAAWVGAHDPALGECEVFDHGRQQAAWQRW